jgi:hypothetical protein
MNALDDFIRDFAGYGHLGAPLWFVGMEEGGGRGVPELQRRVEAWAKRGRRNLRDLAEYHHAIGEAKYFRAPYPLQRTWAWLAGILQAWRGEPTDTPSLQLVQTTLLGSKDGVASLVELLPLPSPNLQSWPYAALAAEHPSLVDRRGYVSAYLSARIDMLRNLVREAQPRVVVFDGLAYLKHWLAISGQALSPMQIGAQACYVGQNDRSYFMAVPHPAARGMTNHFWEGVGTHLREITGAPSEVT